MRKVILTKQNVREPTKANQSILNIKIPKAILPSGFFIFNLQTLLITVSRFSSRHFIDITESNRIKQLIPSLNPNFFIFDAAAGDFIKRTGPPKQQEPIPIDQADKNHILTQQTTIYLRHIICRIVSNKHYCRSIIEHILKSRTFCRFGIFF